MQPLVQRVRREIGTADAKPLVLDDSDPQKQ